VTDNTPQIQNAIGFIPQKYLRTNLWQEDITVASKQRQMYSEQKALSMQLLTSAQLLRNTIRITQLL